MSANLIPELRHALRRLLRTPALSIAAVMSLALGLGAAAVVFESARQLLLARPAIPQAGAVQLLGLVQPQSGQRLQAWSYPAFLAVRQALAPDLAAIAYTAQPLHYTLQTPAGAQRAAAEYVSPGYFEALGLVPSRGRGFDSSHDATPEQAQVAILGHALWRDRFGADPSVVGRTVAIDGHPFAVLGVMGEGVRGLSEQAELWLPIASAPRLTFANRLRSPLSFWHGVFVVSTATDGLAARLPAVSAQLQRAIDFRPLFGEAPPSVERRSWLQTRVDPVFAASFGLIAGCVGLLLALVAGNLVLLMLARVEARRPELALRVALGAGRARVVAALGHELLIIGLAGVALGVLMARGLAGALLAFGPIVRVGGFGIDQVEVGLPTLGFATVLCALVLLLVLLGPGRQAMRLGVQGAGGRHEAPGASARRRWLAGGQVFLATVLAVAAGLAVTTVWQALRVPLGFAPDRVLTARVVLPPALVPEGEVAAFLARSQQALASEAAVESVGVGNCLPVRDGCDRVLLQIDGAGGAERSIAINMVGGDYFRALSVPLRAGRLLDARDDAAAEPAVVINAAAASRYFPGLDPLGRRVAISAGWPEDGRHAQVVGVVGDTLGGTLESAAEPMLYLPIAQFRYNDNYLVLRARAGIDVDALRPALEAAVRAGGAGIVAWDVATMDARFGDLTARRRLVGMLLAGLAGVAVLLAAAGVYAVFALLVQRRQREFGVRLALGADPRALQRGVTRDGLRIAAGCAGAGALLAGALALQLGPAVPGLSYSAPLPYLAALLLTIGAATLACWLPARAAARTAPMAALRDD